MQYTIAQIVWLIMQCEMQDELIKYEAKEMTAVTPHVITVKTYKRFGKFNGVVYLTIVNYWGI